ncbi:hypothetical protein C8J57DRAFT_1222350 [Mycena rebaudengoi]|nr:hypothetical protein C8J57DRAFT_1222350 [Mycena rebaudengoi]
MYFVCWLYMGKSYFTNTSPSRRLFKSLSGLLLVAIIGIRSTTVKRPAYLHRIMTAVVSVLATFGLGAASGSVAIMFMYPQAMFMDLLRFGAAADIVATLAMCMFLKSAEKDITRTSSLLKSLMHLVINHGALVTACQGPLLVTFFASSGHRYWLALHINTAKLYVNAFPFIHPSIHPFALSPYNSTPGTAQEPSTGPLPV